MSFEHQIHVSWGDCDPAAIAYTARIPEFALQAIDAWWEDQGLGGWYGMNLDHDIGTPFVKMNIDFRAPVTPRHRLICTVRPNLLGRTSVGFHVDGHQDGKLCFEGDFVNVFVTPARFEKCTPPPHIRAVVERHLDTGLRNGIAAAAE
ncbi:MAG: acyl-CoA thioesterase [Roseovarius sp.]|nr:acyl-CoA thioesterase [Roseovarius sp.]